MENIERPRNQGRSHGAGRARRFTRVVSLNDLAILLLLFVEPISSMLASFGDLGRQCFDSFIHWIKRFQEQARGKVAGCNRRVLSKDLKSVQFLKEGFSGYIYETTWSPWYGMRWGRYARKDFPGVDSKVFENEAARLVNLDHPNVVKTYCWTVDEVGCSLVMEFVNDDLESVVRKRKAVMMRRSLRPKDLEIDVVAAVSPFELVEAMYIMWHIAAAMDYLHSKKVAHGDLRPNNVMVDLDPGRMIVKVVDFGLVETKKRTMLVSKRAKFLQILEWKAPELCEELVKSLLVTSDEYPWTCTSDHPDDFRKLQMADMYSFAILCTYIMGGKVSYPKSSLMELQQKLRSGTLKPKLPSTCPRRLKKLIELCWSRIAPEKRIDFPKFRIQLEDIIQQETWGGHSLNHPEVGGILQRWVEEIQQRGFNKTLYYKMTATMYGDAKNYKSMTIFLPADKVLEDFETNDKVLGLTTRLETVLLPSSESTKPPPGRSLQPKLASLTFEQLFCESLRSPSPTSFSEEHFSARSQQMIEQRSEYTAAIESEIEASKVHWSELSDAGESYEETRIDNVKIFASLKERYGEFFRDNMDDIGLCIGEKFEEGGQAEIFTARWLDQEDEIALKVFKFGTSLRDLQFHFPMELLLKEARAHKEGKGNPRLCHIFCGLLFDDGRFAFAMERYWGDLRTLIEERMKQNGKGAPPFTMVVAKRMMLEIAEGLQGLHDHNVVHRDVKASNMFMRCLDQPHQFHPTEDAFSCVVGDFDSSVGVVGTGFWRAPEILLATNNRSLGAHYMELFTEKNDVYGFSMTCYEILTGCLPFEEQTRYNYDPVLNGARPMLPSHIHPAIISLVSQCWHHEPSQRPTFVEIVDELKHMNLAE